MKLNLKRRSCPCLIIWLCLEILRVKICTVGINSFLKLSYVTDPFRWIIFPWPCQAVKVGRIWKNWKQVISQLRSCALGWGNLRPFVLRCIQLTVPLTDDNTQAGKVLVLSYSLIFFLIAVSEIHDDCPFGTFNAIFSLRTFTFYNKSHFWSFVCFHWSNTWKML